MAVDLLQPVSYVSNKFLSQMLIVVLSSGPKVFLTYYFKT